MRRIVACLVSVAPLVAMAQAPAAAPAPAPRFDIWEFEIEGNSVLPTLPIESAVLPFLGPERSMADVDGARNALEVLYQKAGYLTVLVDVPEQKVEGGVVRLSVLEGRVGRLSVTGTTYHSPGWIRKQVSEAQEGKVPDFNAMQKQLASVSRPDEISVQPVLKPGRLPGTVDVELKVDDKLPLSGSIEINNDHPRDTDPWRLNAMLRWGNLFQRGHAISLTGITAPAAPDQSQVWIANYAVPLEDGEQFSAYAVHSNSEVESLGGTTALGNGTTLGLRWSWPFGASASAYHSLTAGLDYKDLSEKVLFGKDQISTPVRYLPMQLAAAGNFSLGDLREQYSAAFVWAFRQILRRDVDCPTADGRIAPSDQFACKRSGADGSFAILRLDWRHRQPIGWGQLALRFAAQGASKPLISAEQFALGGSQSVRGYLDSEATGDHGLLGSLELSTPNLAGPLGLDPAEGELSALAFVDAARATTIDALAGQAARVPLLGVGVGLRLSGRNGFDAAFDIAQAHKPTATSAPGSTRWHLRVGMRL